MRQWMGVKEHVIYENKYTASVETKGLDILLHRTWFTRVLHVLHLLHNAIPKNFDDLFWSLRIIFKRQKEKNISIRSATKM